MTDRTRRPEVPRQRPSLQQQVFGSAHHVQDRLAQLLHRLVSSGLDAKIFKNHIDIWISNEQARGVGETLEEEPQEEPLQHTGIEE